jgi:adenosine kinase
MAAGHLLVITILVPLLGAGLLYGLARDWDWPSTGRLAAILGAIKIAQRGAQNHRFTSDEIEVRFRRAFGYSPWG